VNVIIWARVSTREQKDGYSIDAQLRATRDKAMKNGWTVTREFVVAESAKRGAERVAFGEMFHWVKANARRQNIKAILSHKLDRVCRNMRDAVRLQELEDTCGVQLAFVENQFGPGAAGALSFNVMAAVAQYYSDNLRTEVLKGMEERVRQGWPIGRAPFGYVNVDDKDEPVKPAPVESKAVLRIFELYSTGKFTFKQLGNLLEKEGFTYRPSVPRFRRTTLSYVLKNPIYTGELVRHGQVFQGKYQPLIDRQTFEACQRILNGKNRRTSTQSMLFSGGLIRCAVCGAAMTGERIRRKLRDKGIREHLYYRCANNHREEDHTVIRWREEDIEKAILDDFATLRMPSEKIAAWFRCSVKAAFSDVEELQRQQKQNLAKRRAELGSMQDRLLNGYLAASIDEQTFQAKTPELKREMGMVEESLARVNRYDPDAPERALALFDFSQNLVDLWRRSNSDVRREILECVSLNRTISDVSLYVAKRKPFDFIAERAFLKNGGRCWT
jgi:site-specific DNA recombinase